MQVDAAFLWKIKVENNVDCLDIDASGDQIGTDEGFELSSPEPLETFYPFIGFHVGMKIFILVLLFVQLL